MHSANAADKSAAPTRKLLFRRMRSYVTHSAITQKNSLTPQPEKEVSTLCQSSLSGRMGLMYAKSKAATVIQASARQNPLRCLSKKFDNSLALSM